jgi:hypothetical protein
MRLNVKIIGGLAIVILITTAVVLLTRPSRHVENWETVEAVAPPDVQTNSIRASRTLFAPSAPSTTHQSPEIAPDSTANDAAEPTAPVWEQKVDDVLSDTSVADSDVKAERLLALFPTLPEDGQVEAVKHIVNLTSDERYAGIGQYLTNAATDGEVLDELFADLLNRPNTVKLPMILKIAQNPQHPEAGEAKDILELYLEDDYGNDWWKWVQNLTAWLKDNPD